MIEESDGPLHKLDAPVDSSALRAQTPAEKRQLARRRDRRDLV